MPTVLARENWPTALAGLVVLLLLLWWLEYHLHLRRLRRVPVRVHVNGTRGKSTVTRLIAAGLRAHGLRVLAKTTGTEPRLILEDGREEIIHRWGVPSISEQAWAIRIAARRKADAVVLECMAVRPDLQWAAEHQIVHATVGVLTNVRRDHSDAMGDHLGEIAHSLCNTFPSRGVLVTAETRCLRLLQERAARARCALIVAQDNLTNEEWARFGRPEFRENLALALQVCATLGVPREVALEGMCTAQPDPGAAAAVRAEYHGHPFTFLNLLACNDTESVARALEQQHLQAEDPIFLLCLRGDRVARSLDFLTYLGTSARFHQAILVGPGAGVVRRRLLRQGVAPERLVSREHATPAETLDLIAGACAAQANGSVVVGMGNIVGLGGELVSLLHQRHTLEEPACLAPI